MQEINYIEPLLTSVSIIPDNAKKMKCVPTMVPVDEVTSSDQIAFGLRNLYALLLRIAISGNKKDFEKSPELYPDKAIEQFKKTNEYKLYGEPANIEWNEKAKKYESKIEFNGEDISILMSMEEDNGNNAFFFANKMKKFIDNGGKIDDLKIENIINWWKDPGQIDIKDTEVINIIKKITDNKDINKNNFIQQIKSDLENKEGKILKEAGKEYDTFWWAMTDEEKNKALDRVGIYGIAPNGKKITMREAEKQGFLKKVQGGPYGGLPIPVDEDGNHVFKGTSMSRGQGRHYGNNVAADSLVITYDANTGQPFILTLTRKREKCGAMPGGMKDANEPGFLTAIRENIEELGLTDEENIKKIIEKNLNQYELTQPYDDMVDAIHQYCTDVSFRKGEDINATADYKKFAKKYTDISKQIEGIIGLSTGTNFDQRDGMLTDHGTTVFPVIIPPECIAHIKGKEKEVIDYNLVPIDDKLHKTIGFANHGVLINQVLPKMAEIECKRVFQEIYFSDDNSKKNITFSENSKSKFISIDIDVALEVNLKRDFEKYRENVDPKKPRYIIPIDEFFSSPSFKSRYYSKENAEQITEPIKIFSKTTELTPEAKKMAYSKKAEEKITSFFLNITQTIDSNLFDKVSPEFKQEFKKKMIEKCFSPIQSKKNIPQRPQSASTLSKMQIELQKPRRESFSGQKEKPSLQSFIEKENQDNKENFEKIIDDMFNNKTNRVNNIEIVIAKSTKSHSFVR